MTYDRRRILPERFFHQLFQAAQRLAIEQRPEWATVIEADIFDRVMPAHPGDIPADAASNDRPVKSYGLSTQKHRPQCVRPFGVFDADVLALVLGLSFQFEAATQLRFPFALSRAKIRRACQ